MLCEILVLQISLSTTMMINRRTGNCCDGFLGGYRVKNRGFEIVSTYADKGILIPVRKTGSSAGYDIAAAEDMVLLPHQVSLVPTGLKAYMLSNEYLGIHVRSGFSVKHIVSCVNNEGIIDADYYNNNNNEGHIFVALLNHSEIPIQIHKGMRIAQGIFYRYLTTDDDQVDAVATRTGGFGSTGDT